MPQARTKLVIRLNIIRVESTTNHFIFKTFANNSEGRQKAFKLAMNINDNDGPAHTIIRHLGKIGKANIIPIDFFPVQETCRPKIVVVDMV